MKNLYISDLDGTLLHPEIKLTNHTITVLNDLIDRGMNFTVATARSIASAQTMLKDVKITVPIVLMNGVCIYDLSKNAYIKVETLPIRSINILIELIKKHHLKGFAYTIKNDIMSTYYEELNTPALQNFYEERVESYNKRFYQIKDFALLSEEPLIYFTLLDQKEMLEPVFRALQSIPEFNCAFYKDNYSPDLWYLEVFSKTASKYHAVSFLRNNLDYDHIVCFGDNLNDLPLFKASDTKIAVGNAVPELKEQADHVIGTNLEDGVAAWLKKNYI